MKEECVTYATLSMSDISFLLKELILITFIVVLDIR
jgi:hypothetical protein